MYYEVLINGSVFAVVGHPDIKSMSLSVGIYDDDRPAIFASAVCLEDGERWLYDWFHGGHLISERDNVTFRKSEQTASIEPLHKYKMRKNESQQ